MNKRSFLSTIVLVFLILSTWTISTKFIFPKLEFIMNMNIFFTSMIPISIYVLLGAMICFSVNIFKPLKGFSNMGLIDEFLFGLIISLVLGILIAVLIGFLINKTAGLTIICSALLIGFIIAVIRGIKYEFD